MSHLQYFLLLGFPEVGDEEVPAVVWSFESVSGLGLLCR